MDVFAYRVWWKITLFENPSPNPVVRTKRDEKPCSYTRDNDPSVETFRRPSASPPHPRRRAFVRTRITLFYILYIYLLCLRINQRYIICVSCLYTSFLSSCQTAFPPFLPSFRGLVAFDQHGFHVRLLESARRAASVKLNSLRSVTIRRSKRIFEFLDVPTLAQSVFPRRSRFRDSRARRPYRSRKRSEFRIRFWTARAWPGTFAVLFGTSLFVAWDWKYSRAFRSRGTLIEKRLSTSLFSPRWIPDYLAISWLIHNADRIRIFFYTIVSPSLRCLSGRHADRALT